MRAFTFGEPEQVLSGNIGEYVGVFPSDDGEIYKPPVSRTGLAKLLRANAHHGAIPKFKRNLLLREFIPSAGCSAHTMGCKLSKSKVKVKSIFALSAAISMP